MRNEKLLKVVAELPKSPAVARGFFLIPALGVIDYLLGYELPLLDPHLRVVVGWRKMAWPGWSSLSYNCTHRLRSTFRISLFKSCLPDRVAGRSPHNGGKIVVEGNSL